MLAVRQRAASKDFLAEAFMRWQCRNEDVAHVFEKMSRVLALKGKDRFRVLAYEKSGAVAFCNREHSQSAAALARKWRRYARGWIRGQLASSPCCSALRCPRRKSYVARYAAPPGGARKLPNRGVVGVK